MAIRYPARRFAAMLMCAMTIILCATDSAGAQTPAHWTGTTGNWTTAALWSGGVVPNNGVPPGSTYDAFLDAAGMYTVTLNSPIAVTNLTMNDASATLNATSSTLTIVNNLTLTAGVIQLSSATIVGGTLNGTAGVMRFSGSTNNILNGVTVANSAMIDMSQNGSLLQLQGGTSLAAGTYTLGQGSVLYLNQTSTIGSGVNIAMARLTTLSAEGGHIVTLAAGSTVTVLGSQQATIGTGFLGAVPNTVLVNQGTIQFDPGASNVDLIIQANAAAGNEFRNQGIVAVSGSANVVVLNMPFTNT